MQWIKASEQVLPKEIAITKHRPKGTDLRFEVSESDSSRILYMMKLGHEVFFIDESPAQHTGNVQILIDALIDLSNPGADYTIAQKALYVYDSSKPTGVNNGEREDQEALWKEIKDKFFLTNMLNPEWAEEFKKAYTITKK